MVQVQEYGSIDYGYKDMTSEIMAKMGEFNLLWDKGLVVYL